MYNLSIDYPIDVEQSGQLSIAGLKNVGFFASFPFLTVSSNTYMYIPKEKLINKFGLQVIINGLNLQRPLMFIYIKKKSF